MTHKQAFKIVFRSAASWAGGNTECSTINEAIVKAKEWVAIAEQSSACQNLEVAEEKLKESMLIPA